MIRLILVTSGDPDGIGPEVTIKALLKLGPQKNTNFVVFCSSSDQSNPWQRLGREFEVEILHNWSQVPAARKASQLFLIRSRLSPAHWVEAAAQICMNNSNCSLATAPLSKESIIKSGMRDIGHTEILKRVSEASSLFMGFWGSKLSVVLATGHLPLSEISKALTPGLVEASLRAAQQMQEICNSGKARIRPLILLGLNPHAGNSGIIGTEDSQVLRPAADAFRKSGATLLGPLPADSAFTPDFLKTKPIYISMYHDQGLIPFKMAHGFDEGVHLTLGLPFLRTSVDHGTAKSLFGKNKANPASMVEALKAHLRGGFSMEGVSL